MSATPIVGSSDLSTGGHGPGRAPRPERLTSGRSLLTTALPWVVLVAVYAALIIKAPNYLHAGPLSVMLSWVTILGVVSMGQLCVILIGGIDLSVSTVMTMTNVVSASIIGGGNTNQRLPQAVAICLLLGAVVGVANGLIITKLGMPDMIATLAMMTVVYGALTLYNSSHLKSGYAPALATFIAKPFVAFVMPAAAVWLVAGVILIVVLRNTTFGRQVYAVGLSRGASHAAGISVVRTTIILYVISGVCAAAAGVLLTGQLRGMQLASGTSFQLWSIAAVVLGGTSIFGGRGGYGNTIAGAAIIMVLYKGLLVILNIQQAAQNILYGLVILVMLIVFRLGAKRDEAT